MGAKKAVHIYLSKSRSSPSLSHCIAHICNVESLVWANHTSEHYGTMLEQTYVLQLHRGVCVAGDFYLPALLIPLGVDSLV